MRTLEDISNRIPYYRMIQHGDYATELTVNGHKGSCIFSFMQEGWEHVSFAPYNGRTPSWEDMCAIKDIFFEDDEACIQIHPKKSEYINLKDNCLHIWRNKEVPLPF